MLNGFLGDFFYAKNDFSHTIRLTLFLRGESNYTREKKLKDREINLRTIERKRIEKSLQSIGVVPGA